MQKAVAAYPSCIPQAREATTNRMKWVSSRSGFRVVAAGLGPRRTRPAGREPTVPQKRQIGHHLPQMYQIERTNDRGAGARRERARARAAP